MTVFDRVPMYIVEVPFQVMCVSDDVIPIPRLPDVERCGYTMQFLVVASEVPFSAVHYFGEIPLRIFYPHHPMEVIGENYICHKMEGINDLNTPQGFPKLANVIVAL
jgi:hypothetical protein